MDEAAKKKTLRAIPYALYVVGVREKTVTDPAKDLNAFIASWVTQVSFKPPMLVLGVKRDSRSNGMIKSSGVFTLNLLRADQKDTAVKFFKELEVTDKQMNGVAYEVNDVNGCPTLPDGFGSIHCEVAHVYDGDNDHSVVVAKVLDAQVREGDEPLTHGNTGWHYGG